MKRRKLANGIMVLLILVIGAAGVLTAGFIRGWFDRDTEAATLTELRGVVTMKRDGVAYPVEPNTILRRGDVLVTSPRATACIQIGGSFLALNEKSELRVETPAQTEAALTLVMGEAFCQAAAEHPIALTLGEGQPLALREATAFASVRSGARSLSMYAGEVVWGETEAGAGQMLSWTVDALSVEETSLQALNDFAITWMRRAGETMELCYTSQDLDRLEADRAAAMQAQLQQALNPTVPETDPTAPHPKRRVGADSAGDGAFHCSPGANYAAFHRAQCDRPAYHGSAYHGAGSHGTPSRDGSAPYLLHCHLLRHHFEQLGQPGAGKGGIRPLRRSASLPHYSGI